MALKLSEFEYEHVFDVSDVHAFFLLYFDIFYSAM